MAPQERADQLATFGSMIPFAEPAWYRGLPSPYYKASHEKLRIAARAWFDEHTNGEAFDWEEKKEIDHAVYRKLGEDGLLVCLYFGAHIPTKFAKADGTVFGGVPVEEWDGFHDYILNDEFNRCGSLGLPQGLCGGGQIGTPPIYHFGSKELQESVLPDVMAGKKRVCLAITEAQAGSDVKNLGTEAKLSEDGKHYIVNGGKKWITNGMYSDWFTTAVRTSGKPGDAKGVSILLIPRGPGVTTKKMHLSGQWAAGTAYVEFWDVKVPVGNLLGKEGEGFKAILNNFLHERLMITYVAQRLARCCIEDAMAYAHKRVVFGHKLIESEVIRTKLANMSRVVESQQSWIEAIIYAIDHLEHAEANRRLGGTTALLKAHSGITLELCAKEAVQIFGGLGHTRGGQGDRVERIRRDVRGVTIPGGSEEILLMNGVNQEVKLALGLGAKL